MHPYMRDFPLIAKGMDKYLMGETAHQLKSNFETMDARNTVGDSWSFFCFLLVVKLL